MRGVRAFAVLATLVACRRENPTQGAPATASATHASAPSAVSPFPAVEAGAVRLPYGRARIRSCAHACLEIQLSAEPLDCTHTIYDRSHAFVTLAARPKNTWPLHWPLQ